MTQKIVVFDQMGFGDDCIAVIRESAAPIEVVVPPEEQLAEELKDAEIFFGFHTPEVFRDAPLLRWIQTTSAGLDRVLAPELISRGLLISNASGVHAPQVAETAWALTLAVARGLPTFIRQQQEHRWQWGPLYDIDGGTAGIVGLGGIGRRYARTAAALGMRVLALDAHDSSKPEEVEAVWKPDRLDDLLAIADVVLISCPYTPQTHNLIDRDQFAKMKANAILVNIARGGIVNEEALAEALRAGQIAGAGTDVCETEPLPPESPLWDVPNLVITPHCAGLSSRRMRRLADFFCKNLQRYLAGQPLLNVVDQQKGYPVKQGME